MEKKPARKLLLQFRYEQRGEDQPDRHFKEINNQGWC